MDFAEAINDKRAGRTVPARGDLGDCAEAVKLAMAVAMAGKAKGRGGVHAADLQGVDRGPGGRLFQSEAVRFAVDILERLEMPNLQSGGDQTAEGCYACLAVLEEMVPLVGPLQGVRRHRGVVGAAWCS